jgi:hypothetical protein
MIRKVSKGRKRLLNRWEVNVIEITKNTFVVSANDEWEAIDKMELMDKPTFNDKLESYVDVVKKINYS